MPRTSQGTRKNAKNKPQELPAKFQAGFIASLDGRTELARALRERFDSIATDLGGLDDLSQIKASMLERFVWLEASLSNVEVSLADPTVDAKTKAELMSRWIVGVNTLSNLARMLGTERKMRSAPWLEGAAT